MPVSGTETLNLTIQGISQGLVYGLIGVGFSVVYNACQVINFAQGSFVVLGGLVTYECVHSLHTPLLLGGLLGLVAGGFFGGACYLFIARPLLRRKASAVVVMTALFGATLILENTALRIAGSNAFSYSSFVSGKGIRLVGVSIVPATMVIVVGSLLAIGLLYLFYSRTKEGRAWRASSFDQMAAAGVGIRVERVVLLSFVLSGVFGAFGGVIITPTQFTSYDLSLTYAVQGFGAALLGGLDNPIRVAVSGLALGLVESLMLLVAPAAAADVITYGFVLALVLIRPQAVLARLAK